MWNDLIQLVREWGVEVGFIVAGLCAVGLAARYSTVTKRQLPSWLAKIFVGMGLASFVLGVLLFVLDYLAHKGIL